MAILHDFCIGKVRVVYTDRRNGSKRGSFWGANLSLRVGDVLEAVLENRALLSGELGLQPRWYEVTQVHGNRVVEAPHYWEQSGGTTNCDPDHEEEPQRTAAPEADAIVTTGASIPIVIFTADCVPLALGCNEPPGVAVVHAGWRGLVEGVVQEAASRLRERTGGIDWAIAGPSIGPCCYRVGSEILDLFEGRYGSSSVDRNRGTLDLHAAAIAALGSSGSPPPSVISLGPCTSCCRQLFSYRRDGPHTGRQALLAWISDGA